MLTQINTDDLALHLLIAAGGGRLMTDKLRRQRRATSSRSRERSRELKTENVSQRVLPIQGPGFLVLTALENLAANIVNMNDIK